MLSSLQVAQLANVTLRQLQWWDERRVVSPRQEDKRRIYSPAETIEVLMIAEMRQRGLSLQSIRRMLPILRREVVRIKPDGPEAFAVIENYRLRVADNPDQMIRTLKEAKGPAYVISLSDQIARVKDFVPKKQSKRWLW